MKKGFTRIILAVALTTLAASAAHAGRKWQHLGSDNKNNHFMYDKNTAKRTGDIVTSWVSKQYGVDEKVMKEKKLSPSEYHSQTWTLAYYEFDCKENKMRALVGREAVGTGKHISDITRQEFHPADPKSLDGLLLQAICKEVKPSGQ
jgi:hypothetical protein